MYERVYLLRNLNIFNRGSYEAHVHCSLLITFPPCTIKFSRTPATV